MSRADGDVSRIRPEIKASADDIAAWIAARKRNWPTAARVAEKAAGNSEESPKASAESTNENSHAQNGAKKRQTCKFFARGRCTNGAKCRFLHERAENTNSSGVPVQPARIYKRFEPPSRAPLFVKLMQTDLDAENEVILKYICMLAKGGHLNGQSQGAGARANDGALTE